MALNPAAVGSRYEAPSFEVTPEHIARFAAATNDANPAYRGDDAVAPPTYAAIPALHVLRQALLDPLLGADPLRVVHSAAEHRLLRPIAAGDVLAVEGAIEEVRVGRSGESFKVAVTEATDGGELAAEVLATMFVRGSGFGPRPGPTPAGDAVLEDRAVVDADQPVRYADASGDRNELHLDPDMARSAGLPGIILQGMCTLAIASRAAVDGLAGGDPRRLSRVGARFSRPVVPGDSLTTRFWAAEGDGRSGATYVFETVNGRGVPVLKQGMVEVVALREAWPGG